MTTAQAEPTQDYRRQHANEQEAAYSTETPAKYMLSVLPPGVDPQHQQCVLLTGIGLSARAVADRLGVCERTIFSWRNRYADAIAQVESNRREIMASMVEGVVGSIVAIGSELVNKLSTRTDKFGPRDILQLSQAAEKFQHVSAGIRATQDKGRDLNNRDVPTPRQLAEALAVTEDPLDIAGTPADSTLDPSTADD